MVLFEKSRYTGGGKDQVPAPRNQVQGRHCLSTTMMACANSLSLQYTVEVILTGRHMDCERVEAALRSYLQSENERLRRSVTPMPAAPISTFRPQESPTTDGTS
jgi:hypothetical protein